VTKKNLYGMSEFTLIKEYRMTYFCNIKQAYDGTLVLATVVVT